MRTFLFFGFALILVGFAQLESPTRNIEKIEDHAQTWFDNSSLVRYSKIVHHSSQETEDGGKVCYRAIHPAFVDVICLGIKDGEVIDLENYRLTNRDF